MDAEDCSPAGEPKGTVLVLFRGASPGFRLAARAPAHYVRREGGV
jgi:hypothetical protein